VFHKEREYSWMSDNVDVSKAKEDRAVIEAIKVLTLLALLVQSWSKSGTA
jgi:hypothetical protein